MYRGSGASYFIVSGIEIKVNDMPCYCLTNTCECQNKDEMIEMLF
jgi:hypothetical protein